MSTVEEYIITRAEKKNKRKSRRITILVHIVLILLLLIPFFSMQSEEDLPTVFIQFEEPIIPEYTPPLESSSADESSSSEESGSSSEALSEQVQEIERAEPTEFNPVKSVESAPILTSETEAPSFSDVKQVNIKTPIPSTDPLPSKQVSTKVPSLNKGKRVEVKTVDVLEYIADESMLGGDGNIDSGGEIRGDDNEIGEGKGEGTSSGKEKGGKGTGQSKGKESGKSKGSGSGVFDGDGVLTRRIIKRPNLNSLLAQSGKMSVDVCVNRLGKVTYARYNPEYSTIKNRELIKKALNASDQYVFEHKLNAPRKECGRLTINIIIEK